MHNIIGPFWCRPADDVPRRAKIKTIAKKSVDNQEDLENFPESMRKYLALQAFDSGKGLSGEVNDPLSLYNDTMLTAPGVAPKVGRFNRILTRSLAECCKLTCYQQSSISIAMPSILALGVVLVRIDSISWFSILPPRLPSHTISMPSSLASRLNTLSLV